MTWRGQTIVDVSREFLASNGAPKSQHVRVPEQGVRELAWKNPLAKAVLGKVLDAADARVSTLPDVPAAATTRWRRDCARC